MRALRWLVPAVLVAAVLVANVPAGEEKVPLDKVPKAIMDAVKVRFPGAKLIGATTEKDGDKVVYEIELQFKGLHHDVTYEPGGKLLLIEREIAFKDLPRAVRSTLSRKYPKATYKLIEEVIKVKGDKEMLEYYEAHLQTADKESVEVEIGLDGKIKQPAKSPEKKEGKKAKDELAGWTTRFVVDRKDLVSVGRNPYYILEPGHQLVLEGGSERLVITVLNETKMVDGVETRVVEERETKGGQLVEVSRNYFAICKRSNSVYYFGEDVDHYKKGKVVSHEGSWLAGVKGARFGLYMPGLPLVGARYYQELAPGAGMDRAEILSVSETVKTPAGVFKNCLKTRETSPLEPATRDHKFYAPNIGLIRDGSMALVSHGMAPGKAKSGRGE
jgi:hypothetical protein